MRADQLVLVRCSGIELAKLFAAQMNEASSVGAWRNSYAGALGGRKGVGEVGRAGLGDDDDTGVWWNLMVISERGI